MCIRDRLTQDVIEWVKFSGATWAPDSEGFYYSAYDAPKANVYSSCLLYTSTYNIHTCIEQLLYKINITALVRNRCDNLRLLQ